MSGTAKMSRLGTLDSRVPNEDIRTLVAHALQIVGAGLSTLPIERKKSVNDTVCGGGRVEVRVAVGTGTPQVSLVLCDVDGHEIELGFTRLPDVTASRG